MLYLLCLHREQIFVELLAVVVDIVLFVINNRFNKSRRVFKSSTPRTCCAKVKIFRYNFRHHLVCCVWVKILFSIRIRVDHMRIPCWVKKIDFHMRRTKNNLKISFLLHSLQPCACLLTNKLVKLTMWKCPMK